MISTRRSYVYDEETGLYYLQSRYYNPEWGRFLNADALVATGQGMLGNNMFAYCRNNPVCRVDISGAADADCLDVKGDDEIEIPADDPHFAGRPAAQPGGPGSSSGGLGPAGGGAPNTPSGGGGTPNVPPAGSNIPSTPFPNFPVDAITNGQTGYGQAPKQGVPGTVYTQVSSDGNNLVISQTMYNEYGMPGLRVDYGGHSHGTITGTHVHLFTVYEGPNGIYLNKGPVMQCYF